jgi:hypothetical protein
MTQKEQKTLQYLERELAAYAEKEITDGLEANYPGHNEIVRNCIRLEPFYGTATDGPDLVYRAMEYAGYSSSTMSKMYNPSATGTYYLDKFEALLRQTETYKNIVYTK